MRKKSLSIAATLLSFVVLTPVHAADIKQDTQDIHQNKREEAKDKADLNRDKKDIKSDRKDRRQDHHGVAVKHN